MVQLVLKDNTQYEMEDGSNVGAFRIPVENYAEVDTILGNMTKANLETVVIGTKEYHDVILDSVNVQTKDDGTIVAIFLNRMGTSDLIQDAVDAYTCELLEMGVI